MSMISAMNHILNYKELRLSLATILPLFQLELIGSLQFTSLRLVPSDIDTNVKLSGTITVKIDSPFGKKFPLNIQTLDMNTPLNFEHKQIETLNIADAAVQTLSPLSVTYQTTFNDVQIVASMKFNKQLVNHSLDNKLEMEFVSKPLTILDYHAFQQFSATLLFTPNVKVMINGSAEPIAITNMGILTLNNILIVDELSLIGFNQFQATNGLILTNKCRTIKRKFFVKVFPATIQLYNPFNINMIISALSMKVFNGLTVNETQLIGSTSEGLSMNPIIVPGKQETILSSLNVTLNISSVAVVSFAQLIAGTAKLNLFGTINMTIGDILNDLILNDLSLIAIDIPASSTS
ncbi:unnamed protein product [Didymodactylos carnosus]|uniref:Uncharacterized protein n=1 Tax=Didymodactylos carnosus TaxID=1234261 RepID=A0A814GCE1_9BILA|nr:unnamed protein product [Didymodactylos carnosus]CAF3765278.1 unnamed protein product [Didymodactylos carnosus]